MHTKPHKGTYKRGLRAKFYIVQYTMSYISINQYDAHCIMTTTTFELIYNYQKTTGLNYTSDDHYEEVEED